MVALLFFSVNRLFLVILKTINLQLVYTIIASRVVCCIHSLIFLLNRFTNCIISELLFLFSIYCAVNRIESALLWDVNSFCHGFSAKTKKKFHWPSHIAYCYSLKLIEKIWAIYNFLVSNAPIVNGITFWKPLLESVLADSGCRLLLFNYKY